ncbi:MAG: phosphatidylserine decarboxylase [Planctomycetota bacterium]
MLARDARPEWLAVLGTGAMLAVANVFLALSLGPAWLIGLPIVVGLTAAVLAMFRDPDRRPPSQRGALVSPVDGKVSSVHDIDHHPPFNGPARCVRVFISLMDVHVVRAPLHGRLAAIDDRPGKFINALRAESPEVNTAKHLIVRHPARDQALASIRLIAGAFARTIHLRVMTGEVLQRSQRIGIIKLGSTAELYVPLERSPEAQVAVGDRVRGGETVLLTVALGETTIEEAAARQVVGESAALAKEEVSDVSPEPAAESETSEVGDEIAVLRRVESTDEESRDAETDEDEGNEAEAEEDVTVDAEVEVEEVVWEEEEEEEEDTVVPASEMQLTLGSAAAETDKDAWGMRDGEEQEEASEIKDTDEEVETAGAEDEDGLIEAVEEEIVEQVEVDAEDETEAEATSDADDEEAIGEDAATGESEEQADARMEGGEVVEEAVEVEASEPEEVVPEPQPEADVEAEPDTASVEASVSEPVPAEAEVDDDASGAASPSEEAAANDEPTADETADKPAVDASPPAEPEPKSEPEPEPATRKRASRSRRRSKRQAEPAKAEPEPTPESEPEPKATSASEPDPPANAEPSVEATDAAGSAESSATPSHGQSKPHPRRQSARQRKAKRKRR